MRFDTIYNDILKEIKPSPKDREEITMLADKLMNIILEHAKTMNIEVTCKLVGSVSKKTSLVNKADIDIFIAFPLEYDEEKLKEYGLHLGKYCIDEVNGKCEKKYASHPYITGHIDGYEVDFVPCYKIKDASELKSAVDRTILHTNYVQKHLTDEEADEVLLLKKFMTSVNTYGANYKVSWICPKGHHYDAWISDRTGKRKTGCPECSYLAKAKSVICIETGEIYESPRLAAEAVGKKAVTISHAARDQSKTCGGYHWKYV